jgi:hypothetical protein
MSAPTPVMIEHHHHRELIELERRVDQQVADRHPG